MNAACSFLIIVIAMTILMHYCQAQDTSCVNQLVPCLNYLNGTKDPPSSCCDPLKSVIKSNPECLCTLASSKGNNNAEQAGINVTEAQLLPGRCGQNVNPIACLTDPSNNKNSEPNSVRGFSPVETLLAAALSVTLHIWANFF